MMKWKIAGAMLAVTMTLPAAAAAYLPSGVQTNVALSTVTDGGWTLCYSSLYADPFGTTHDAALAQCSGDRLMLAARETGSDTILLLAQAGWSDVITDVGNGNTTHNANGVEWYYSPEYSWGFAQGGDAVNRSECDQDTANGQFRLCWHTMDWIGGWRAGEATWLNDSTEYERLIFASSGGVIPEPATWALMIAGFGLVGFTARRRQALTA